ncbi:MAG: hypothetical protein KGS61_10700 [Verrucomicrobia bacterium]|nr:hypothetical protein [Verrucomicrobiota bacterium]
MHFHRDQVRQRLTALVPQGDDVGTSSCQYPGWRGRRYGESRYVGHGDFAEARFDRACQGSHALETIAAVLDGGRPEAAG